MCIYTHTSRHTNGRAHGFGAPPSIGSPISCLGMRIYYMVCAYWCGHVCGQHIYMMCTCMPANCTYKYVCIHRCGCAYPWPHARVRACWCVCVWEQARKELERAQTLTPMMLDRWVVCVCVCVCVFVHVCAGLYIQIDRHRHARSLRRTDWKYVCKFLRARPISV